MQCCLDRQARCTSDPRAATSLVRMPSSHSNHLAPSSFSLKRASVLLHFRIQSRFLLLAIPSQRESAEARRAMASRARHERAQHRRAERAILLLQTAFRRHRAQRLAAARRVKVLADRDAKRLREQQLQMALRSRIREREEAAAAATLQAVARRRRVKLSPTMQARQMRRSQRAKVERVLLQNRAAREIQRIARGMSGRRRALLATCCCGSVGDRGY